MLHNRTFFLLALCLFSSGTAWAGPPFATDDPEPVEYRHWEINYALSLTKVREGTSAAAPSIDINYGLLDDLQLHAQPEFTYEKEDGEAARYGVDNLELGVKYRFFDYEDEVVHWMVSVYPSLELPSADRNINSGERKVQAFLPVWFQRDSEDWTIYGGAGYHVNRGDEARNSYFVGIAAMRHITERLQLGGEVFRETAAEDGEKAAAGFNAGGKYDLSETYHLLFSAGKGLIHAATTNQFSTYLGLQTTF